MKRLSGLCCCLLLLAPLLSVSAAEPWERLGQGVQNHAQSLGLSVEESTYEVVAIPIEEIGSAAQDIEYLQEKGREYFYFKGLDAAREFLNEPLRFYLEASQSWWAHKESAESLFLASLYLLRSYVEEDLEGGEELARRIAAIFPAHQVDLQAFPPKVIDAFQKGHREARESTIPIFAAEEADQCRSAWNGASTNEIVALLPGRSYVLARNCGGEELLYWVSLSRR